MLYQVRKGEKLNVGKNEVQYCREVKGLSRTPRKEDQRIACARQTPGKARPNWGGSGGWTFLRKMQLRDLMPASSGK